MLAVLFYWMTIVTGRFFIASLDNISDYLRIPPDIAGATFMAVGTSAPELFTTIVALLILPVDGIDVGVGNVIGSAIFQILVVVGIASVARRAHLSWRPIVRDSIFYAFAVVLLLSVLWDGQLTRVETSLMVGGYGLYLVILYIWNKLFPQDRWDNFDPLEEVEDKFEPRRPRRLHFWQTWQAKAQLQRWWHKLRHVLELPFFWVPDADKDKRWTVPVFGFSLLAIAGITYLVVEVAVKIAAEMGLPPAIIALTILAGGSSIPEVVASYIVSKEGRGGMAISNAIGSNTFDVLMSIGLPYFVVTWTSGPISVASTNILSSGFLLFMTLMAVTALLAFRRWNVNARLGSFLIFLYLCYVVAAYQGYL